ncbi:1-aminocyclopropane-1-carboxylate deaminase [Cytophagales bacterium WSM2-2]|nr:1-aminocyclopropane-1-carboxylate deaminase [Cytophagales bacterium WSM2-2]
MLKYSDTHIIELRNNILLEKKIGLAVKLEYQNHPLVSGNKWWKLKYNLDEARKLGHDTILTFGGAFSNHIYATAAAAKETGFNAIGIIRGEEALPLNKTLQFAKDCGMYIHYISREKYRTKNEEVFVKELQQQFGNFYLIPEGGTNLLAVKACAEFAQEKLSILDFDFICLPVGTGGTMAGVIVGLKGKKKVIGFSVLKDGGFLQNEVKNLVREFSGVEFLNWHLETDCHFGGYAKSTPDLDNFISQIKQQHGLQLEFVYTGKMMKGVFDLISKNYFPEGSKILVIHTGGLQN